MASLKNKRAKKAKRKKTKTREKDGDVKTDASYYGPTPLGTDALARGSRRILSDCPKCGTRMVIQISCPKCHYSPETAYTSRHEAKEFTHPG